ncbi:MAG: protein kinase [Ruminococcus sp.]|nr:protein kinase [Ruminococcus sp.]
MEPSVKLCMGCMNELDADGSCHYCSYTDDIPHLQSYLAPRTVLDNRYVVGKMLSYNGEGASYICYDMVGKCKCVCREYMPDTLCERDMDGLTITVNPDCLAKYKTFMSEFADMNKVLSRMRNLNHIATAKDMFYENNTTYVILEYVEGVSLKKFLQSNTGYLTWDQVKKLFVPLFTTLSIIHNAGIIHRGISPENIIVTTDGELKLTGFCISSIRTSNTGLIPEFYSGYTAPEQYTSLQWQGTWTDVYAVSAVIYRILTGCMPLDANTRIHNDTMVEAARVNPRIPRHISNVLADAMAVRGEDRIQTVTELVSSLFEQQPVRMEHQKGATQTIPIQHIPNRRSDNVQRRRPKKKQKNSKAASIVGWIVLAAVLTLGAVLLVQLLSGPPEEGTEPTRSYADIDYGYSDSEAEDDYDYGTTTTSVTTVSDESGSEYGYGSIMPSVIGMIYSEVERQIGEQFTLRPVYYYSDVDEPGLVKGQGIPEGSDYDPELKNELELEVCAGPPKIPVPDCSGYLKKDYLDLLDSLNIKYKVENDKSYTVAVDYVISTSTPAGKLINIEKGDVLTVFVCDEVLTYATTTTAATTTTTAYNDWGGNDWGGDQQNTDVWSDTGYQGDYGDYGGDGQWDGGQ